MIPLCSCCAGRCICRISPIDYPDLDDMLKLKSAIIQRHSIHFLISVFCSLCNRKGERDGLRDREIHCQKTDLGKDHQKYEKALSLIAAAAMTFSLAACSSSDSSADTGEKAEAGSGKLVIYSPNSDTEIENELAAFQEKYPDIQVDLQSMGTGDCVARIEAESENPQADVMWGGMNYGVYKQNPDLWEEYVSKNDENVDENYRNDTGYFSNYVLSGSGAFIKNDKLLKELGVEVNSYEDLLQPG